MRRTLAALLVVLVMAGLAWADDPNDGIGINVDARVMASVRELVRLGVPKDDVLRMTREMVTYRFTGEQILRVHAVVRETVREGLPQRPVTNKAYEGMVKDVDPEGIIRAMEQVRLRYASAYRHARMVAQDDDASALGDTIAECMAAGLQETQVARLTQRLTERIRISDRSEGAALARMSFMTVREMVRMGASTKNATDTVCLALERSWSSQDMERLRAAFMAQARYRSPDGVVAGYARRIGDGQTCSEIVNATQDGAVRTRSGESVFGGAQGATGTGGAHGGGTGSSGGGSGSGSGSSSGSGSGGGSGSGSGGGGGAGKGGRGR